VGRPGVGGRQGVDLLRRGVQRGIRLIESQICYREQAEPLGRVFRGAGFDERLEQVDDLSRILVQ
jgi:hypothetical protein